MALAGLRQAQDELSGLARELDDLTAEIEAPAPPEQLEAEIDEAVHNPLVDLDWGFARAAQALKARKAYLDEDDES